MSYALCGPFPLDLGAISWSARRAMDNLKTGKLRDISEGASRPGLYLIVHLVKERRHLAGFWISFKEDYLSQGPAGPPDRSPPFIDDLLTAVTEQVWWVNLETWPRQGSSWTPIVVLEWPPALASRCTLPPPGSPLPEDDGGMPNTVVDDWSQPSDTAKASGATDDPMAQLPSRRSLLVLVRCKLTQTMATHRGEYQMLPLDHFPAAAEPLATEQWLELAWNAPIKAGKPPPEHVLGSPLALPAGRVGFLLSGWLTRDLSIWPIVPMDIRPGVLGERDISNPITRKFVEAVTYTGGVILGTLALGLLVNVLAHPSFGPAPKTEALQAQPALATCSADHDLFIEELRCQVKHFADGGTMSEPDCMDAPTSKAVPIDEDLQAAWCGLVDRPVDAKDFPDSPRPIDLAEVAATRACFNVLRRPYRYDLSKSPNYHLPDPVLFLDDPRLKIASLAEIVTGLHEQCARIRTRMERKVEGAVLATHVGVTEDGYKNEAEKLRKSMVSYATSAMHRKEEQKCFELGAKDGLLTARKVDEICEQSTNPIVGPAFKVWGRLGSDVISNESVVKRYADARFGKAPDPNKLDPLWQCYQDLETAKNPTSYMSTWSLNIPEPHTWSVQGGGVYSELALDSMLRDIAAGKTVSTCWKVVANLLSPYQPLHPMLGPPTEGSWPSSEQQLCGQVCAVYYHVREAPASAGWSTPVEDLLTCLGPKTQDGDQYVRRGAASPSLTRYDEGFDYLRMPWNAPFGKDDDTWQTPDRSALCAFNLVAQGYLSSKENPVLIEGMQPPAWAGTLASRLTGKTNVSGDPGAIAGGTDGAAYQAAVSLNSYGRAHSIANCGHVAAQCFAGRMLTVMQGKSPHQWVNAWAADVAGLYQEQDVDPWCTLIQPFLAERGTAHEGQLDYPCTQGVAATRGAFNTLVDTLSVSRREGL